MEDISIDMATIQVFLKSLGNRLSAFYRGRVQEDIMQQIKLPSKGKISRVSQNEVDKISNGPFLIKLCVDVIFLRENADCFGPLKRKHIHNNF